MPLANVHAREVSLSVVSTNIKTLEIFSLEFVWSGPTEPNLNFLVRIFELHVNKSVTKIANRTQLYNLNVQIELLKYSTRINLRQRLPTVYWRVCKQTADQYVFSSDTEQNGKFHREIQKNSQEIQKITLKNLGEIYDKDNQTSVEESFQTDSRPICFLPQTLSKTESAIY